MPSLLSKPNYTSCHATGHTWCSSCSVTFIEIFFNCFRYSLRLYTPLYVISGIVSQRKKEYFMKKLLQEILQSSLFLACNGGFMVFYFCLIRKLLGHFRYMTAGFIPGFLSSLTAIFVERKSRRGALAVYMLNQAFDTTFNIMKSNGWAAEIPFGEVLIFAGAMGAIMYMYRSRNLPDGFIKDILEKCFKKRDVLYREEDRDIQYIKHSSRLSGKAFLVGYTLQASYNLLMALPKLLSNPAKLFHALVKLENFKTGGFIGGYIAIYKFIEYLLTKSKVSSENMNAVVSGSMAGLSMMFLRNSYISLYVLCKAMELFYMNGIQKGIFPYYKHFDSLLYAVCTGTMFHAAILQPLFLRKQYWSFLLKLTGEKFDSINRAEWDPWGLDSSKIDRLVAAGIMKMS